MQCRGKEWVELYVYTPNIYSWRGQGITLLVWAWCRHSDWATVRTAQRTRPDPSTRKRIFCTAKRWDWIQRPPSLLQEGTRDSVHRLKRSELEVTTRLLFTAAVNNARITGLPLLTYTFYWCKCYAIGRAVLGRSAALACCDCGFESRHGHMCLYLVSFVGCQVSATRWSLIQGNPINCDALLCVLETSWMRHWTSASKRKKK
jgi:hypothetical protein